MACPVLYSVTLIQLQDNRLQLVLKLSSLKVKIIRIIIKNIKKFHSFFNKLIYLKIFFKHFISVYSLYFCPVCEIRSTVVHIWK